jgi:hypothetical protein
MYSRKLPSKKKKKNKRKGKRLDANHNWAGQMTNVGCQLQVSVLIDCQYKWNKKGWVWVWRLLASELHRHWHPIIEQALDWEGSVEHCNPSELCHGTRQNKEQERGGRTISKRLVPLPQPGTLTTRLPWI